MTERRPADPPRDLSRQVTSAPTTPGGHLPVRLTFDGGDGRVEWIATDGSPYTEPFFEDTRLRLLRLPENRGRPPRETPVDALAAVEPTLRPDAVIFHVSRCGSTLVSQMLAALPTNVVLSEAPLLDDIVRAHRRGRDVSEEDRIRWLRGAVHALAEPVAGEGDRLFVKLDCWHLFETRLVRRAFPEIPFLFVHRDPLEVLVSLMRVPSLAIVRGTVTPEQLRLTPEERDALGPEELAAAVLGAFYREATLHRDELVPIAYPDLPERLWAGFPGCEFSEREVGDMKRAARRDAKNPRRRFEPDAEEKRRSASEVLRAACARRTETEYAKWLEAAGTWDRVN